MSPMIWCGIDIYLGKYVSIEDEWDWNWGKSSTLSSNELDDYRVGNILYRPTFPDLSRWGPDSFSLLGWKSGKQICACFSKSRYSVEKLYLHLREIREEKGCFWDVSPIFYAWEAAYLNSQHLIPATLNTLIIVLALQLKALLIIWIKLGTLQ